MFKKFNRKDLILTLASGLFYGLSFPPINFSYLIFFSFVILLDITFRCRSFKEIFIRSYFVFFTAGLVAISWITFSGMRQDADSFLIFAGIFVLIVYPLFFVPPVILFYYINRNLTARNLRHPNLYLFIFPFLWTGFEYLQTQGQINFPWLFAGNTQTYNLSKIQFAEYTGLFGVSFWISFTGACLFFLYNRISTGDWKLLSAKSAITFSAIVLIFFLPDIYTSYFKRELPDADKIKIGIIQPNINPWKKWSGTQNDLIYSYTDMIRKIHADDSTIKMVLLPETALPYYFREKRFVERYAIIKDLCDSLNLPLLIGTPDLQIYEDQSKAPNDAKIMTSTGLKYDTYNSAVLFEPLKEKNNLQKHDKIKLVIGSERVPYQEIFSFTKNIVAWGVGIGSWQIGKDTNIFLLDDKYKFNTAICYESVYPEFFSEFVNKGAEFSVIITNDGWWGKFFGTYQHNRFAVFRAIENRRWIARCANTGISDFIDPDGNMYEETPINEKENIIFNIGVRREKTFFTEHGDWFSKICLYIGLILFALSFAFRRKNNLSPEAAV